MKKIYRKMMVLMNRKQKLKMVQILFMMVIGAILAAIFIPIFIESINAATVCANDPNATVEVFGQQLSCQQLLEQSGR